MSGSVNKVILIGHLGRDPEGRAMNNGSREITHGHDGRIMTQSASIRMCGNSVSPVMARALVAANYIPDEAHEPTRKRQPIAEPVATLFEAAE